MKIFVTGATGVIGRRLVPLLVRAGHKVTAHVRTPAKQQAIRRSGALPVDVDLFDASAVRHALEGHDAVANLATHMPASAGRMLLPSAWRENTRIRKQVSRLLAEAASACGAVTFIQESFAPIYPDCGDAWVDETVPVQPASYNASVVDAENSAHDFSRRGGRGVVLRFAAFYGPDARHLHDLIKLVRKGFAPLLGTPDAFVSSISHDDAANAVIAALDCPAGIYNVGDDEPVTHREYVNSLADALGVAHPRLPPAWFTALTGPVGKTVARSLRISNSKLKQSALWRPRYSSVRQGWQDTVAEMLNAGRAADETSRAA
jgi:2-alkyl-3-oxoalkanoate reductase